jgi:16S rRNA (cytidine1402-2'-O)-methyltransferase
VSAGRPTLWLVATPIGNLADLAPRAVEVLSQAALVCCEDTRRTGRLLQHAGIRAERLAVANEHTEQHCAGDVIATLAGGRHVALVTDAGSPGISDPGERIVRAVLDAGHPVAAVPGPVAAIAALTISGLPTARFVFEGFLPRSGRNRRDRLEELRSEQRTVVLYEAPHRIARTITDLATVCGGERRVAVCRELTKLHEEVLRGTLSSIELGEPRGEYVVVLEGAATSATVVDDDVIRRSIEAELDGGASVRDAASAVSARLGVPRRSVYSIATEIGSVRKKL